MVAAFFVVTCFGESGESFFVKDLVKIRDLVLGWKAQEKVNYGREEQPILIAKKSVKWLKLLAKQRQEARLNEIEAQAKKKLHSIVENEVQPRTIFLSRLLFCHVGFGI